MMILANELKASPLFQQAIRARATLLAGVLAAVAAAACGGVDASAEEPPQVKQARGIDLGGNVMALYVARDKATWDAVQQAAGERHEFPGGKLKGEGLERLDGVDFQQEMVVAVFWGEMNFSGHDEKCWIEGVSIGETEVTVDCRASLWGGDILRSFRAWPYDVKVVRRSELPVTFKQTTEYTAKPGLPEKEKIIAKLKSGQWKREIPPPK